MPNRLPPGSTYNGAKIVTQVAQNTAHPLGFIRGHVTSLGAKAGGEGFTCSRTGLGWYTIVFEKPFLDAPLGSVNPLLGPVFVGFESGAAPTKTGFSVRFYDITTALTDTGFIFTMIGQTT